MAVGEDAFLTVATPVTQGGPDLPALDCCCCDCFSQSRFPELLPLHGAKLTRKFIGAEEKGKRYSICL